jgi:hypothetical protein
MTSLKRTALLSLLFTVAVATAAALLWLLGTQMEDDDPDGVASVAGILLYPAFWFANLLPGDNSMFRFGVFAFLQFVLLYGLFMWLWLGKRATHPRIS